MLQGSPEWHAWRLKGVGGSEVPSLLGLCPYDGTPYKVFLVKSGRSKGFEGNSFTEHGKETEGKARSRYELINMEDMESDVCAVHPQYSVCRVSLDGISLDRKKILEIKCPKGDSTISMAKAGKVPEHYMAQIQYQLAVSGADSCDFFVYHSDTGEDALVTVLPDIEYQGRIIAAVLEFWEKHVVTDIAPPLTDKDVLEVSETNLPIKTLCERIKTTKDTAAKKEIDRLKAEAVALAGHPKMRCGDVQISTVIRNGKFSYHKLTIKEPA